VIVEVHLTMLEEAENDEHLRACHQAVCGHQAHLVGGIVDRCGGLAEVFEFVTASKVAYEKRLRYNTQRRDRDAQLALCRKQEARSLAVIRRGWQRLYGVDEP
jgi:hypothetical protein